jgi:hypothetical protein
MEVTPEDSSPAGCPDRPPAAPPVTTESTATGAGAAAGATGGYGVKMLGSNPLPPHTPCAVFCPAIQRPGGG